MGFGRTALFAAIGGPVGVAIAQNTGQQGRTQTEAREQGLAGGDVRDDEERDPSVPPPIVGPRRGLVGTAARAAGPALIGASVGAPAGGAGGAGAAGAGAGAGTGAAAGQGLFPQLGSAATQGAGQGALAGGITGGGVGAGQGALLGGAPAALPGAGVSGSALGAPLFGPDVGGGGAFFGAGQGALEGGIGSGAPQAAGPAGTSIQDRLQQALLSRIPFANTVQTVMNTPGTFGQKAQAGLVSAIEEADARENVELPPIQNPSFVAGTNPFAARERIAAVTRGF